MSRKLLLSAYLITMYDSLAMMEMTLAMAHFYRRFAVTLADPDETMPLVQQFIMKPSKSIEYFRRRLDYNSF
jgi:hypothetical protein